MATLDFPSTIIGQNTGTQYNGGNGVTYIWDGYKWIGHSPTLAPGSNSISNGPYSFQIDTFGNLNAPNFTFPYNGGLPGQVLKWPGIGAGTTLLWQDDNSPESTWRLNSGSYHLSLLDDGSVRFPNGGGIFYVGNQNTNPIVGTAINDPRGVALSTKLGNSVVVSTSTGIHFYSNSYTWNLAEDGHFHLPGGGRLYYNTSTLTVNVKAASTNSSALYLASPDLDGVDVTTFSAVHLDQDQAEIRTGNATNINTWKFDQYGNLSIPGSIDFDNEGFVWWYDPSNTGDYPNWAGSLIVAGMNDVIIGTNLTDGPEGNYGTWRFGADGALTLPSGNTRIGDFNGLDAIVGSTGTGVLVAGQGPGGFIALEWIDNNENIGTTASTQVAAVIVNSPMASTSGTVQIATGLSSGPTADNIWEFGADGNLTAPGHLLPNADLSYDLGSTTTQWRSIYVGTGTIFIGGVALGVNQDNYVTVDGNPIITVNTAGNFTVQGDTNIVLGAVVISDTAPPATTPGSQWYNSVDGRTYVAYNGAWVDASPVVVPSPGTYLGEITIDGSTLNINGGTLTIDDTGTLLVNGSEVTGSGTGSSTHIEYTDGQSQYTSTVDLGYNFEVDTQYAHLNINGNGDWEIGSNNFDTKIFSTDDPGNEPKVIVVRAGDDDWTFGPLGWFTLPNGGVISEVGGAFGGAIRLEPSGASSATQALVIYPTAGVDGNHIHLTAGGGGTDLYLGDDNQYVKVDHTGTIVIGTLGANTSTWTFGTNGILTLSTASTILGTGLDPNVYIETSTTATTSTWTFGTDGVLTLPAATPVIKGGGTGTDVTIVASTGSNTSTWVFGANGSVTFPDATVQRTAYLTGQQTVLVNAASTGTAIELTELTGTVIWVDAEPGYNVPSETHYLVLPYQDNPVNPNIPLGTRITVINNYSGTVAVRGWPGGPFSEYQMANGESIDLVYHYNFNYGGNLWWITNTFNW